MEWGMDTFSLKYSNTFIFLFGVGKVGTFKQTISEHTLFECECIEGRGLPKSKMAQLLEDLDQLKHETEELTVQLSSKRLKLLYSKQSCLLHKVRDLVLQWFKLWRKRILS